MPPSLARASVWAVAGSFAQYAVVFLLLVYLAHILQPRDFGLMSMVAVGLEVGAQVVRWGQVELLQMPRHQGDAARNQSLRLSLILGLGFCALFVLAARPLGRLYGSSQLTLMMYICAPVFVFSAIRTTPEAILRSEFRFRLFAFRSTVTTIVGAVVAAVLALRGLGALALAIQSLAQSAMLAIWVWGAVSWRPRLFRGVGWSPTLLREGGGVMAGAVLPLIVPRSVDLIVGVWLGPTALGLMRVAFRINDFVGQMVVMPLVSVASAQLGRLSGDLPAMRLSYLRLTQASAALMCPVLIGLALVAPEAIPIIFGPKWRPAVPLVQILSLLALVAPMNYYFSAAMVACGQSRLIFRQGVFQLILGLSLAAAAAQISLQAVLIAHVVRGALVTLYNIRDLRRQMKLTVREVWRFMSAPYLSTLVMAGAVFAAHGLLGAATPPWRVVATLGAVGAAAYGAALWGGSRIGLWPPQDSPLAGLFPPFWRRSPTGL